MTTTTTSDTAATGPAAMARPQASLLAPYSIEVMPKSAAAVDDFRAVLPADTRVYVAHIEGTPIDEMVATVRRIADAGFAVMPHVPARVVASREVLETWLRRYREEAGTDQALVLAGGVDKPYGEFENSMQLLETGLFDQLGFRRLHVAGHPEGNRDIDPDGGTAAVDAALQWKQKFANRTDIEMAITTQFCFDAEPVLQWAERLQSLDINLPINVGLAGPAKLQTLIRFAIACGVGNSLRILKKQAASAKHLLRAVPPDKVLHALSAAISAGRAPNIQSVHIYPFGGIQASAQWAQAASTGQPGDPQ